MTTTVRQEIISFFKLTGFSLQSDATKYLLSVLTPVRNEKDRQEWMNKIISFVQKEPLETTSLSDEILERAVKACSNRNLEDSGKLFDVINVVQMPKYVYCPDRKKFINRSEFNLGPLHLYGTPDDKANVFRERYYLIYQRLLRHELFATSVIDGAEKTQRKYQLRNAEALLASSTKIENVVIFGMISMMSEGKFGLEDPTGIIPLDLTDTKFQTGLYTENCFCLMEGHYEDGVLFATACGFVPPESASATRTHFGGISNISDSQNYSCDTRTSLKLAALEQKREDATFVFVSDVWLDSTRVMDKIRILLNGFESCPPVAFIFAGDFASKRHGSDESKVMQECFRKLADLIQSCPNICQKTHFVFVPSERDPFLTSIFPKPPLPNVIVQPLAQKIPNCHFPSNPCRLQYCTQEIVVFRCNLVDRMLQTCFRKPSLDEASIPCHFAKSILCQSHLLPFPLHVAPVYWAYDYTLRLYPLPDLVVCCDTFSPFTEKVKECVVTNPGSFAKDRYTFKVYVAASREVEDSKID